MALGAAQEGEGQPLLVALKRPPKKQGKALRSLKSPALVHNPHGPDESPISCSSGSLKKQKEITHIRFYTHATLPVVGVTTNGATSLAC